MKTRKQIFEAKTLFKGFSVFTRMLSLILIPGYLMVAMSCFETVTVKESTPNGIIKVSDDGLNFLMKALVYDFTSIQPQLQHTDNWQQPSVRPGNYQFLNGRDYGIPWICHS